MTKVLFDHNMPPMLARCLHEAISPDGHEAYALRHRFSVRVSDVELYNHLGKEKDWITISKDTANAKRKPEREAILRSGVLAFYLAPSIQRAPPVQQAALLLWHWDRILQQRKLNERGLFLLPENRSSKFRPL